jgi:hypothetical protein
MEVDIAPLCCEHFSPPHAGGHVEENECALARSQFGK